MSAELRNSERNTRARKTEVSVMESHTRPTRKPACIDLGTLRMSPFLYPEEASEQQDLIARDMIEEVIDEQRRQGLRPGATPMGSENTTMQRAIKRMAEACASVSAFIHSSTQEGGVTAREISNACGLKIDKSREAILRLIDDGVVRRAGIKPHRYVATTRQIA